MTNPDLGPLLAGLQDDLHQAAVRLNRANERLRQLTAAIPPGALPTSAERLPQVVPGQLPPTSQPAAPQVPGPPQPQPVGFPTAGPPPSHGWRGPIDQQPSRPGQAAAGWAPPTQFPQGQPQPGHFQPPGPRSGPGSFVPGQPAAVPLQAARPPRRISVAEIFSMVGSFVTLIGVALVLLLPQDGLLSSGMRVGIGVGLAAAAISFAFWQRAKQESNIGAQALMATGVASAFLCVVAASTLLHNSVNEPLLPLLPGLVLAGLIGLGGMWIAHRWDSQWLAVLAVLGSLLIAPLLAGDRLAWAITFMVVMSLVTVAFQYGKRWIGLLLARDLPTAFVFLIGLGFTGIGRDEPILTVALSAILALAGLGEAAWRSAAGRAEQIVLSCLLAPLALPLMVTIQLSAFGVPVGLVIGLAFSAAGLFRAFAAPIRAGALPTGALLILISLLRLVDSQLGGYVFFGLAVIYFLLAARLRLRPALIVASALFLGGGVAWLPTFVGGFSAELARIDLDQALASPIGLAATLSGAYAIRAFGSWRPWLAYPTWGLSVAFGSSAVVLLGTYFGVRAGQAETSFMVSHAVVTVSWLVLCVVQLRMGLRAGTTSMIPVQIAVVLAAAAVAKLFLFDLATLPGLVRALAFLVVGLLLLAIGTWYSRQLEKVRRTQRPVPDQTGVGIPTAGSVQPGGRVGQPVPPMPAAGHGPQRAERPPAAAGTPQSGYPPQPTMAPPAGPPGHPPLPPPHVQFQPGAPQQQPLSRPPEMAGPPTTERQPYPDSGAPLDPQQPPPSTEGQP